MRTWIFATAVAAALASLPTGAEARDSRSYVSVGYSYGYPVRYRHGHWYGYPYYGHPYYGPFGHYYPRSYYGVGVQVGPRATPRRARQTTEQAALKLYVYPAAGQSEQQLADDRYECHVWSAEQSEYDPTLGAGTRAQADDYSRAFTACMEGRDYVVR